MGCDKAPFVADGFSNQRALMFGRWGSRVDVVGHLADYCAASFQWGSIIQGLDVVLFQKQLALSVPAILQCARWQTLPRWLTQVSSCIGSNPLLLQLNDS